MKNQLAKAVFWVIWSRGGIQLLTFVSTVIMARLLNPSDYGLMTLAGIWTHAVALIAEMGLGMAIIQFRDLEERELNTCFWLTMGLAVAGYLSLYVAAPFIATWFTTPALTNVLRVSGLALPLVAARVIPDGLLRKRLALDRVSQAELFSVMASIPVMCGLAWVGLGVWALVAGALIRPLIQGVVSFWFVRWWPGLQVGGKRSREVISYSLATLGSRVCTVLYQGADTLVLGKLSGDVVLGLYSFAKQLSTLPLGKVTGIVNMVSAPMMARVQADREAMRTSLLRGVRLVACVTFPMCFGLRLVAEDFVRVILTDKWMAAVPMIRVLSVYAMLRSLAVLLPPVLMARYRAKFLFGYNLVKVMVMPLAFWAGAAWLGPIGVAAGWVTVYPVLMAGMAHTALREIDMSWSTLLSQLWPPLAATSGMAVIVLSVRWGMSAAEIDSSVARLVTMIVAGGLAYGAGLLVIGRQFSREIMKVLGWVLHRDGSLRPHSQPPLRLKGSDRS